MALDEIEQARKLAARYQYEFVDLQECHPDVELLRTIPLELMVRYQFLPLEEREGLLVVPVGDPTDLARLNELEGKLGRPLSIKVAALGQVNDFLKKPEPSQRVLDE